MIAAVTQHRARALATTGAARSPALPDLPTLAQAGLNAYELNNWLGFVAPPHSAAAIVAAQASAISAALQAPAVSRELAGRSIEAIGGTPAEFSAFMAAELARWRWLQSAP